MQNFALIQTLRRSLLPKLRYKQPQAGFTLLELLVVVLMIGVLAAIAAPSWLGFINQRRVNSANEVFLRALQEAQSKAKTRKLSYSVSFRTRAGESPEFAIYPTQDPPDPNDPTKAKEFNPDNLSDQAWRSLGEEVGLKAGQVLAGNNLDGKNIADDDQVDYKQVFRAGNNKITFDYNGNLPLNDDTDIPTEGLIIAVAVPQPTRNDQPIDYTRRCIKVRTLLGTLQTGRGDECGS